MVYKMLKIFIEDGIFKISFKQLIDDKYALIELEYFDDNLCKYFWYTIKVSYSIDRKNVKVLDIIDFKDCKLIDYDEV